MKVYISNNLWEKKKNKINGEQYWFRHPQSEGFTRMSGGDPLFQYIYKSFF